MIIGVISWRNDSPLQLALIEHLHQTETASISASSSKKRGRHSRDTAKARFADRL